MTGAARGAVARLLLRISLRPAPGWLAAAATATLLGAVCISLYPYGFRAVVDGLLSHAPDRVLGGLLLAGGCYSVGWVCQVMGANLTFEVTDRVGLHLASEVARRSTAIPGIGHFDHPDQAGELDMAQTRQSQLAHFPRYVLIIAQIVLRLAVVLALLVTVYPPLALLPLAGVIPYLAERAANRLRERTEDRLSPSRRLTDELFRAGTTPKAALEVRVFDLAPELAARHAAAAARIVRGTRRSALIGAALRTGGWSAFTAALLAGCGITVLHTARGSTSPGQLLMVLTLVRRIQLQFPQAADALTRIGAAIGTARRVVRLRELSLHTGPQEIGRPMPQSLCHGITLEGVGFTFPAGATALRDVDLYLPAGRVVALFGSNGSGKTTLVKLLTRMYEPDTGRILVDGVELTEFTAAQWRTRVTGTMQDFQQYDLTAGANVGVGDVERGDDPPAQWAALSSAGADTTVRALPDGLDTRLGRSAGDLSGGQWQQIALARGLLRDAPLLMLLDEPTASMDPKAEYDLVERYARVARETGARTGATTLLVSHRLSTARIADLIVLIEDGRVRECGSHDELVAARGEYADLYRLQAEGYR